ncbi:NAD(P)H-hydrate dehydratase [Aeribacillus composti]|uniref:NAD(P)H-hydrate dehydratase n=1 Tax=Aeribacillus composti TaxID=1868734 RepID=UPI002E217F16|nr:NAD(P)H-hydrate dehydratase [Aeribacillus composti]
MFVYTEEDIRNIDNLAEKNGLSSIVLMENAGRSLFQKLVSYVKKDDRILILSGKGNNGGDGIVLARYLKQNGYHADLSFPLGAPKSEAAKHHFAFYKNSGFLETAEYEQNHYQVIVDALLGVGARHPLRDDVKNLIEWINGQNAFVVSVDVPSGVLSDSGEAPIAVKANVTISIHGYKRSAFLLPSSSFYGKKEVVSIGLKEEGKWKVWTEKDVKQTWPNHPSFSHKGTFGTGYLIAGSDEMPGSVLLAAKGAMRAGIGKLVIGTTPFVAGAIAGQIPEATYFFEGLIKAGDGEFPEKLSVCAIGPGIVPGEETEKAIQSILQNDWPVVLDAGALQKRTYPKNRQHPIVLTPHPGEFSRLIDQPISYIQKNRIEAASKFAVEENVIVVLKGQYTVIAFPDGTGMINPTGNIALGKGGSGDALTGIIAAFLSYYENKKAAVANAVYLHGLCADLFVKTKGVRSMLAGDIPDILPEVMKRFE